MAEKNIQSQSNDMQHQKIEEKLEPKYASQPKQGLHGKHAKMALWGSLALVLVIIGAAIIFLVPFDKKKEGIALGTATITGKIFLPEGSQLKPSDLHIKTMLEDKAIEADGNFSVTGFDAGRQLAVTNTSDGQPVFLGFISKDYQEISSKSTAEVLLFQASGALYLPYSAWPTALDAIHAFVAEDEQLAKDIGTLANQDFQYLTNDKPSLGSTIDSAMMRLKDSQLKPAFFEQLFRVPSAKAQTEPSIDTDEKSAVRIDPGVFNDVKVTNGYRRIVRANFYQIGYKKEGQYTALKTPQFTVSADVPSVGKLTDLASTVYDLVAGEVHYAEKNQSVVLPNDPKGDVTMYKVLALGWGANSNESNITWRMSERDNSDLQEITVTTALQEIAFPLFMMAISTDKAQQIFDDGDAVTFIKETSRFLLSDPRAGNEGWQAILGKLREGNLKEAGKGVVEFVAKSDTFRNMVTSWAIEKISAKFGQEVANAYFTSTLNFLAKPVRAVDWILKGFDATTLAASFKASNQIEEWEIAVRPAKIALNPQSAEVSTNDIVDFKVEVQTGEQKADPNTGEVKINLTYEWYNKNKKMGEFKDRTGDVYSSTKNIATYTVKDDTKGDDTIEVKAYWLRDTGTKSERIYLGSKTAEIVKGKSGDLDKFAQCLKNKGVKLYSAEWCSHCQNQIALFGTSAKFLPIIECFAPGSNVTSTPLPVCGAKKIIGYPMWEFVDGSRLSGLQQLQELAKKSGCKL